MIDLIKLSLMLDGFTDVMEKLPVILLWCKRPVIAASSKRDSGSLEKEFATMSGSPTYPMIAAKSSVG
jgi:hypothetical protein